MDFSAVAAGDWRDFRARLVQQELKEAAAERGENGPAGGTQMDGWAYETPLIEQGAILLSTPSNHFAINQQYFHKNVIILVEHSSSFTKGIILNRPTALSIEDMSDLGSMPVGTGIDEWNVWFGGDCQGVNDRGMSRQYFVLHALERFADEGQRIIPGVYSIQLDRAKTLVELGEADKDDFLLLVGYCGWGPGQLQRELDAGDSWTMAAVDQRAVLGELREAQAALRRRIVAAAGAGQSLTASDVGDGLEMWERLYVQLGPTYQQRLLDFRITKDSNHTDEVLRCWIDKCLIPSRYSTGEPTTSEAVAALGMMRGPTDLKSGTILRSSATSWMLGKPSEHEMFDLHRFLPSQYFHKAVLVYVEEDDQSMLALLNGPIIDTDVEGPVRWGGPHSAAEIKLSAGEQCIRVLGVTALQPGTMQLLMELHAFEPVTDVVMDDLLGAPEEDRWWMAGGSIKTLKDAQVAKLADVQRRLWYKRFINLDVP